MFELNLIKEKIKINNKRKRIFLYFKIIYGVCFIVFFICLFKSTSNLHKIKSSNQAIVSIKKQIEENKTKFKVFELEKEWTGYLKDLTTTEQIVNNKTIWAARLQEISVLFPPGIFLNKIAWAKDTGSIILDATALPEEKDAFTVVDNIIKSIGKDRFFAKSAKLENQKRIRINNGAEETEAFQISIPCTGIMP